jgi:hypothetical protein
LYDLLITALDKWYEPRNQQALVDLSKSLAIPDKTVAEWREGIRHEREKLLAENNHTPEPTTTPLLEQVLAVLTPNQSRIVEYLWDRKTARYETLREIP